MSVVVTMGDHGRSDLLSAKEILARELSLQRHDGGLVSHLRASSAMARNSTRSFLGASAAPGPLPSPQHLGRALVAPPSSSSPLLSSLSGRSTSPLLSSSSSSDRNDKTSDARLSPFLSRSLISQAAMIEALAASKVASDARLMFATSAARASPFLPPSVSRSPTLATSKALEAVSDAVWARARLLSAHGAMSLDNRFPSPPTTTSLLTNKQAALMKTKPKRREPIVMFMECDEDSLSEYQCLIRKNIELFEATAEEAACSVQGRNKQVVEGQVGIRCRHCCKDGKVPVKDRPKGCMYFPTKLDRIYQAAQNLSAFHLCEHCPSVPKDIRQRILVLKERKSPAGGGKKYWSDGVRVQGVYEDGVGLRFS